MVSNLLVSCWIIVSNWIVSSSSSCFITSYCIQYRIVSNQIVLCCVLKSFLRIVSYGIVSSWNRISIVFESFRIVYQSSYPPYLTSLKCDVLVFVSFCWWFIFVKLFITIFPTTGTKLRLL
jgi:hypothetical protein